MRPIDTLRTWNASQSWNARQHFATPDGQRLRFDMRRNAYDEQSHARVDALDPASLTWSPLVSRSIAETPAAALSYVSKALSGSDLVAIEGTRDALLGEAAAILGTVQPHRFDYFYRYTETAGAVEAVGYVGPFPSYVAASDHAAAMADRFPYLSPDLPIELIAPDDVESGK